MEEKYINKKQLLNAIQNLPEYEEEYLNLPLPTLNLKELNKMAIIIALRKTSWSQKKAANLLGISSRILNYRIKNHKITNHRWKKNI